MKKRVIIGIGAVLVVALLAGAAFMAARLLGAAQPGGTNGPILSGLGNPAGKGSFSMSIQITPAPEIPTGKADLVGQVASVKDNSIFVTEFSKNGDGQGISISIGSSATGGGGDGPSTSDGGPSATATPSGPATEVVVSKDTVIYRDTTMDSVPKPSGSGSTSLTMTQKVEPADISQIAANYMVQVWGQKRGDRLIADTIVVMGAAVIQFKAGDGGGSGGK
jgi:hypothetical protein